MESVYIVGGVFEPSSFLRNNTESDKLTTVRVPLELLRLIHPKLRAYRQIRFLRLGPGLSDRR